MTHDGLFMAHTWPQRIVLFLFFVVVNAVAFPVRAIMFLASLSERRAK